MASTSSSDPETSPTDPRALVQSGWNQGVLLPSLPELLVYSPVQPVARAASRDRKARKKAGEDLAGDLHLQAVAAPRTKEWCVVASQICDLAKSVAHEPRVDVLRAFETDSVQILGPAERNSVRYFLLDPARGLVADAAARLQIEKPVLGLHSPLQGIPTGDPTRLRRFARWLARRYDRPALPDAVVEAIGSPIRSLLVGLMATDSNARAALDTVEEVRINGDWERAPFRFRLLFLVSPEAEDTATPSLAPLVARVAQELDPRSAILVEWVALSRRRISLADAEATEPLFLEDLTTSRIPESFAEDDLHPR